MSNNKTVFDEGRFTAVMSLLCYEFTSILWLVYCTDFTNLCFTDSPIRNAHQRMTMSLDVVARTNFELPSKHTTSRKRVTFRWKTPESFYVAIRSTSQLRKSVINLSSLLRLRRENTTQWAIKTSYLPLVQKR